MSNGCLLTHWSGGEEEMNKIRIGVVGLGIGQAHVETINRMDDAVVAAVADNNPNRLRESLDDYAARYGAKAYNDAFEMMESEELDAVNLCVSPKYRLELMTCAAEKGIPIMVEKPFATNVGHGRRLIEVCEKHNATVMLGFCIRYMPPITRLRELMDGELGQGWLLAGDLVIGWCPPPNHWAWDPENGNGFVNENSCHLFDTICHLMGKPVSVHAAGRNFFGRRFEDGVALSIQFENGGTAALTCGALGAQAFNMPTYINIFTENGQAKVTGDDHMFETLTWATRDDKEVKTQSWEQPPRSQIVRYSMRHFVDCLRSGEQPTATLEDGIIAVAMAMGLRESLQKKAPVELSW